MEFHQLRYFCAAAETGSFTQGARREGVSQPSLSEQIIKLETELNVKLFERTRHRVRLTAPGKSFLRSAKMILDKMSEAQSAVRPGLSPANEAITVGVAPTITPYLLTPALKVYKSDHPTVRVRVVEDFQNRLLAALREASLDLALLHLPVMSRDLRIEEISRQPLFAAIPESHPLANRPQLQMAELRDVPLLLLRQGFQFRTDVWKFLRRARIQPVLAFEGTSIDNLLAMATAGAGISLVPKMATTKRPGCAFVPIAGAQATVRIGCARLRERHPTPAQRSFVETLAKQSGAGPAAKN